MSSFDLCYVTEFSCDLLAWWGPGCVPAQRGRAADEQELGPLLAVRLELSAQPGENRQSVGGLSSLQQ